MDKTKRAQKKIDAEDVPILSSKTHLVPKTTFQHGKRRYLVYFSTCIHLCGLFILGFSPFFFFHDPEKLNNETSYEKTLLGLSQDISFLLEEFHELKQDIKISISGNKAKLEDIDEQMKKMMHCIDGSLTK